MLSGVKTLSSVIKKTWAAVVMVLTDRGNRTRHRSRRIRIRSDASSLGSNFFGDLQQSAGLDGSVVSDPLMGKTLSLVSPGINYIGGLLAGGEQGS
jgi:hypothetical protein